MKFTESQLKRSLLYAEQLGIRLSADKNSEFFKWFLASLLFGGRISETIAVHTYQAFEKYNLLSPQNIIDAGWDFLVNPVMREGGYVRYDESKSSQLLRNCQQLLDEYGGSLKRLHTLAEDRTDLEQRLLSFHGVGPMTLNIFLRELRPYWKKADPESLKIVDELASAMGIKLVHYRRKTISYCRLEAGLIRHRKQLTKLWLNPGD